MTLATYSELSNKHAANLILFEEIFPPTCLIRTYTFIYFQGKFLPSSVHLYMFFTFQVVKRPNYQKNKKIFTMAKIIMIVAIAIVALSANMESVKANGCELNLEQKINNIMILTFVKKIFF